MTSYSRAVVFCVIVAALFCSTLAAIVNTSPCEQQPGHGPSMCTIHEVRVHPCKEAAEGNMCRIRRRQNASIEFDYTAAFEGDKLEVHVYSVGAAANMKFLDMNPDACLSTPCPIVPNKKQTYHFDMFVSATYPKNKYNVQWQMMNSQGQDCCFLFDMELA